MKWYIYLIACFIFIALNAQDGQSIADQHTTLFDVGSTHLKPPTAPLLLVHHADTMVQRPSFLESFQGFLRQLIIILTNDKLQSNVKFIEMMIFSLIKTALQIIRNQHLHLDESYETVIDKLDTMEPAIKKSLLNVIIKGSESAKLTKGPHGAQCHCEKVSDTSTKAVLAFFAQIVQNFFNILQDPHNSESVTPNLMGMLAGIVAIGNEVMKKGIITEDSDDADITRYVRGLNKESKEQILILLHNYNESP